MKIFSAIVVFALLPFGLMAQDKIQTERPSESQSTKTVSKGTVQGEFGFRKEEENELDYRVQHPNVLLRYGLLNKLELRLQTAIESERLHSKNEYNYGLTPIELGLKAAIFQTKDTSFSFAVVGQVGIPKLAAKSHEAETAFHRIRLLFENELTKKIKVNYNVGTDWDEDEQEQDWVYTITPEFELTKKWNVFVEEYSFIHKHDKPEHYIDGGVSYSVNHHLQWDILARKGISSHSSKYIIGTGISIKL